MATEIYETSFGQAENMGWMRRGRFNRAGAIAGSWHQRGLEAGFQHLRDTQ
jgi:hypothetical protein